MLRTIIVTLIVAGLFVSCNDPAENKEISAIKGTSGLAENELLLKYLETYGNYINSVEAPALVTADELNSAITNPQWFLIDIRPEPLFSQGHIGRAYHISYSNLPAYLKDSMQTHLYTHIVLIDEDGMSSGYAAGLLRLLGYGNVYSLKFGMSSWNKKFADYWENNCSSDYLHLFDTAQAPMPPKNNLPVIQANVKTPDKILETRILELFSEGPDKALITAEELDRSYEDYFIINYSTIARYKSLHLKASVLFQNRKSLHSQEQLLNLPSNNEIVVYCMSGHKSVYVTAFLRVLGYKAYSLAYGLNGMVHSELVKKEWTAFTADKDAMDYSVIEGTKTIDTVLFPKPEVKKDTAKINKDTQPD